MVLWDGKWNESCNFPLRNLFVEWPLMALWDEIGVCRNTIFQAPKNVFFRTCLDCFQKTHVDRVGNLKHCFTPVTWWKLTPGPVATNTLPSHHPAPAHAATLGLASVWTWGTTLGHRITNAAGSASCTVICNFFRWGNGADDQLQKDTMLP
jgi:hypothetical protein